MAQSDLTRVIEPACQKLAQQFGFELVDVELARGREPLSADLY